MYRLHIFRCVFKLDMGRLDVDSILITGKHSSTYNNYIMALICSLGKRLFKTSNTTMHSSSTLLLSD